jgi:ATP-dependent DNA helicase DinG
MPRFGEKYYSLDLKKNADFGPAKAIYTLRCRLISYGSVKETKNLILTPGGGELRNHTQWNSLKKLIGSENILIFALKDLKHFFDEDEFKEFVPKIEKRTIEISKLCSLFLISDDISSPGDLTEYLNDLFNTPESAEDLTPEILLGKLAELIAGFDRGLRKSIVSLLSPVNPLIADWLDSLKEKTRQLPQKFCESFPSHFVTFESDESGAYVLPTDEQIDSVFSSNGRLKEIIGDYELRPEQRHMAKLFARAINNHECFVAEAGTGTGKSLAYLVPAIFRVTETSERVAVSTYTKTLQTQLFFSDLKLAAAACGRKLVASILKGRSNYLCLLKKNMLKSRARTHLAPKDYFDLARLEIWESLTTSGDLAEINFENRRINSEVAAESNFCLKQACQFYKKCYFFKARRQSTRSQIVIINQALFFSDMLADSSILGGRDLIIFDEAHRLEKTATSHLGGELDRFYVLSVLNRLYQAKDPAQSILIQVENLMNSQAFFGENTDSGEFKTARELTSESREVVNDLFERIKEYKQNKGYRAGSFAFKLRYDSEKEFYREIYTILDDLKDSLKLLKSSLRDIHSLFSSLDIDQDSLIQIEELNRAANEINSLTLMTQILFECDPSTYVFWLEISNKGFAKLCFSPLSVGETLNTMIHQKYPSILFTSASLGVEGYFDFFEKSIGLNHLPPEQVIRKSFGSSFDFYSQLDFYCPVYLPSPKSEYYTVALAKFISFVLPLVKKKALILCTSNQILIELYRQTKEGLRSSGIDVLAQSVSGTAEQILSDFKKSKLAVIFGTDSFWEGVDLPGSQLELLMITRLPFATPAEPIEAARMERLESAGENSFVGYSLPNAVLKFKQGFGRLIRQKSDKGIIIVTDNRLRKARFGQTFLNSVPAELNIIYEQDELIDKLNI